MVWSDRQRVAGLVLCFEGDGGHGDLRSFPPRRSSDLGGGGGEGGEVRGLMAHPPDVCVSHSGSVASQDPWRGLVLDLDVRLGKRLVTKASRRLGVPTSLPLQITVQITWVNKTGS